MPRRIPTETVPNLSVTLVGGGRWALSTDAAKSFTLIAFYRGLHCPVCRGWLAGLQNLAAKFSDRGVSFVALSMDTEARAVSAKNEWHIPDVPLGYALSEDSARAWGLYFSAGIKEEPSMFSEPGLFLVKPDKSLYFAAVQTMPFTRPAFGGLIFAIDYAVKHQYPARSELT